MVETSPSRMTVDEFMVWAEGRPGRYELDQGCVFAMSPERVGHLRAKAAARNAFAAAITKAGLPCEALPDSATIRIDATTAYDPDALVYCGQLDFGHFSILYIQGRRAKPSYPL